MSDWIIWIIVAVAIVGLVAWRWPRTSLEIDDEGDRHDGLR